MTIHLSEGIDRLDEILGELEGARTYLLKRLARSDAISRGDAVALRAGAEILEDELEQASRRLKTIDQDLERLRLAHETSISKPEPHTASPCAGSSSCESGS